MSEIPLTYPEVVVTAGGTREPIDDVRYVGNFSGGHLGHALASRYASLGYNTLLLAPRSVIQRFGHDDSAGNFKHRSFTTAKDLEEQLLVIPKTNLVLHAAAVSDYTPVPTLGKISSDEAELVIRMRRNPKILGMLREHFGDKTTLVGFKLLSCASEAELVSVAKKQIDKNNTDLCIANDLYMMLPNERTVHIVQPDGDYNCITGSTVEVAQSIASLVLPKVLSHE
jgi:phosphopantothenoylcysteine synthetase/decarboxylase